MASRIAFLAGVHAAAAAMTPCWLSPPLLVLCILLQEPPLLVFKARMDAQDVTRQEPGRRRHALDIPTYSVLGLL